MRIFWIVVLMLGTLAWGQANPVAPKSSPDQGHPASADVDDDDEAKQPASIPRPGSKITDNTAVLTIEGLCNRPGPQSAVKAGAASSGTPCQTIVTRAQFEKLVMAIMPAMSPQSKRQFANSYPRLLVMAHEAQARGLDKTTRFEQILAFARLQILSQELVRDFKEEAAKVSESDIADYYRNNAAAFERVSVERIFVPLRKMDSAVQPPDSAEAQAQPNTAADEMTKEADALRARAVAGEHFTELQQDAYHVAGIRSTAPASREQKLRRAELPPTHAAVFGLKPGEVSPVFSDSTGHYIYKLDSKDEEPLTEARAEIRKTLQNQRLQAMMDKINHSFTTDVNQAYFGEAMPKAEDEDND